MLKYFVMLLAAFAALVGMTGGALVYDEWLVQASLNQTVPGEFPQPTERLIEGCVTMLVAWLVVAYTVTWAYTLGVRRGREQMVAAGREAQDAQSPRQAREWEMGKAA